MSVSFSEQQKKHRQAIISYLKERCKTDPFLAMACEKENKSLDGVMAYIYSEAQKLKEGNCAMVEDSTVYDWAVHYILEDSIDFEKKKSKPADVPTKAPEVKPEPKTIAMELIQPTLF